MRIVIFAQNASTKFGGEALLLLNYFRILRSRQIETRLVVYARTQAELTALFPEEGDRMHFVPDTWLHPLLSKIGGFLPPRIGSPTFGLLSHLYTQVLQRRIVRRLVSEHQIDVVHEPTPVSATFPSLMFGLEVPIAMGPLNVAVKYPATFQRSRKNLAIESLIAFGPGRVTTRPMK